MNLNHMVPNNDGNFPVPGRAARVDGTTTTAHFDGLESALVDLISRHDVILGCVAWLTSKPILEACCGKDVHFIVQKEDFLRPDHVGKAELRRLYALLNRHAASRDSSDRNEFPGMIGDLSCCGDQGFAAVRCVGNHNSDRRQASPRMHHKFCLFGTWIPNKEPDAFGNLRRHLDLSCVWTGSFNFTHNGGRSLENAVVIRDEVIVRAYYDEFAYITALSEPLDWESEWSAPQWRVGT